MKTNLFSQEKRILAYLKTGKSLTALQAFYGFNCLRCASRIHRLKSQGHDIKTEMIEVNGKWIARYSLKQIN